VEKASHEAVAWRYREQMALYLGNTRSAGHGLTSLEDESYELSGVVDIWRNPKSLVFETITELNRPLQVNLWLRPSSIYDGDPITFDATLLNEAGRLAPGKYPLSVELLDQSNKAVRYKEYSQDIGRDLIELLTVDTLEPHVPPGRYRLRVRLGTNNADLVAQRPVVVFAREPKSLAATHDVWVWDENETLHKWFAARSIVTKSGDADGVQAGDTMFVIAADPAQLSKIHDAVLRGARAVILDPNRVFATTKTPVGGAGNFADGLWAFDEGWRPELRQIGWWGAPGAWGYGRTALALQHPFLASLPQGVALEAQPEYQRVAPRFTWTMQGRPQGLDIQHAVMESNVEVDTPYTSDLFQIPCGDGILVLTSLQIAPGLNVDPASDRILENIATELLSSWTSSNARPTQRASDR
jgi:hypothetical protein